MIKKIKVHYSFSQLQYLGPHNSIIMLCLEEGLKDKNISKMDSVCQILFLYDSSRPSTWTRLVKESWSVCHRYGYTVNLLATRGNNPHSNLNLSFPWHQQRTFMVSYLLFNSQLPQYELKMIKTKLDTI